MSYMLGYGHEVWSAGNYYFWVCHTLPLHPRYLPLPFVSKLSLTRTFSDPNGCALLRLHLWRFPLRCFHLHWRVTDKYTVDGIAALATTDKEGVVEFSCLKREMEKKVMRYDFETGR